MIEFLKRNSKTTKGFLGLAVHTPTQQSFDTLMRLCDRNKIKWADGVAASDFGSLNNCFGRDTVIYITRRIDWWRLTYGTINIASEKGYNIFKVTDILFSGFNKPVDINKLI